MLARSIGRCMAHRRPRGSIPSQGLVAATYFHTSGTQYSGGGQKSPLQVFVETFKNEWNKSKELQDNIKALQGETDKMAESEAYKKAKEAYEKAKKGTSKTTESLKKAGKVVGDAAYVAWESPVGRGTRQAVSATADTVSKVTEPIRESETFKNVKDVIEDGNATQYGGFEEKDTRRKRRQEVERKRLEYQLKHGIHGGPVKENPEAGESVVLSDKPETKKSLSESWEEFKVRSPIGRKLADLELRWEESENGLIAGIRTVSDKVRGIFAETEAARVTKMFKEMDPTFNMEFFQRELREYIIPEVLDAYVKGDGEVLKKWLSEAPYNIWAASTKQYLEKGLVASGRVLDIRGVDILSAKMLPPNDTPVFVIGCRAQEIHLYRDGKTGKIAAGTEDHIQLSTYAFVLARVPEELGDPETKGWKIMELVRGQSREWT